MGKILYRYVLKETTGLFSLILGIFLFVLLMGRILQVVDLIVRHGVSPWQVSKMLAYLIAYLLPFAIPMATLIAVLLCFSRLSGDLEITALKSAGIGLYQFLPPVALFSITMFLVTLFITIQGAPWGAFSFRKLAFQLAKEHISVAIKEGVFKEIFPNFVVYADRIEAREGILEGVFIYDKLSTEVPLEIIARRGLFSGDHAQGDVFSLRLENGTIYQNSLEEGKIRRIHFQQYEINLDRTLSQVSETLQRTRRKDMDTRSLLQRIERLRSRNRPAGDYLVELHRRLTVPFSCLVFGLLALPLALQSGPRGRSHGLLIGSFVMLVYYLLYSMGKTLAESGLPPRLGLWGPNLLFGFFAVSLLLRTAKERPSPILVKMNMMLDRLQRWGERFLGRKT
jgi:lipopolysaccharide export system permease protein